MRNSIDTFSLMLYLPPNCFPSRHQHHDHERCKERKRRRKRKILVHNLDDKSLKVRNEKLRFTLAIRRDIVSFLIPHTRR